MKYFSESKVDGSVKEITEEDARFYLEGYNDIDTILETEGIYPILYRFIIVKED